MKTRYDLTAIPPYSDYEESMTLAYYQVLRVRFSEYMLGKQYGYEATSAAWHAFRFGFSAGDVFGQLSARSTKKKPKTRRRA